MARKLPPLTSLRAFEAAARLGSFSKAAAELCVTQSAVSHQVRQLEDWFGAPLFDRFGRAVTLNHRGAVLTESLGRAFEDIERACRRARAEDSSTLTVAVIPSVASCWVIPRLDQFLATHPEITVRLIYAFHRQPPDFGEADIEVRYGEAQWADCQVTPFLPGRAVPVASCSYAERAGPFSAPQHFLGANLFHDTDRSGWVEWFHKAGLASAGSAPGPIFEDFNLLRAATLAGQGVALCATALLRDDLAAGRLKILSDLSIHDHRGYYILEPKQPSTLAARQFKSWLLDTRHSTEDAQLPAGQNAANRR